MQTPVPVLIEQWIKIAKNKKNHNDLREISLLHLRNIRDIIDQVIRENEKNKYNWKPTTKK